MFGLGKPGDDLSRPLAETVRSAFTILFKHKGSQQGGQLACGEPAAGIHGEKAFLGVNESRRPGEIQPGFGLNRGVPDGITGYSHRRTQARERHRACNLWPA